MAKASLDNPLGFFATAVLYNKLHTYIAVIMLIPRPVIIFIHGLYYLIIIRGLDI